MGSITSASVRLTVYALKYGQRKLKDDLSRCNVTFPSSTDWFVLALKIEDYCIQVPNSIELLFELVVPVSAQETEYKKNIPAWFIFV